MMFNVSGLIQEGIGATRRHDLEAKLSFDDREEVTVTGEVEFLRTKAGVLVRAWLNAKLAGACSRCLTPLQLDEPVGFEEEFQAAVDLRSGAPLRPEIDPDAFLIDEHHMLDLTEAVRQYLEASAAMQPLCRPDCRGLCPRCGSDLNNGECNCEGDALDSRWERLAILRGGPPEGKD
jgi:uncharacterized protein